MACDYIPADVLKELKCVRLTKRMHIEIIYEIIPKFAFLNGDDNAYNIHVRKSTTLANALHHTSRYINMFPVTLSLPWDYIEANRIKICASTYPYFDDILWLYGKIRCLRESTFNDIIKKRANGEDTIIDEEKYSLIDSWLICDKITLESRLNKRGKCTKPALRSSYE